MGNAPATKDPKAPAELPDYLQHCDCGKRLTNHDLSLNCDEALELTGGYSCQKCIEYALGCSADVIAEAQDEARYYE